METFHSHGKFLISAEYLILHGAQGLTLPLPRMTQSLTVTPNDSEELSWEAYDENNQLWLRLEQSELLQKLLAYLKEKKPKLFETGLAFKTHMNFSHQWGLGSSSTLIANLAQWSGVSGFELQQKFFGGSGYDVAAATSSKPFLYELQHQLPVLTPLIWEPEFKQHMRFVYLGQKQDSREAMAAFKAKLEGPSAEQILHVNELTHELIKAKTIRDFSKTMTAHEQFVGSLLGQTPVKERLFSDFPGAIKSLGGWGGDFVLALSEVDSESYFHQKGHSLIFKWQDLI